MFMCCKILLTYFFGNICIIVGGSTKDSTVYFNDQYKGLELCHVAYKLYYNGTIDSFVAKIIIKSWINNIPQKKEESY